MIFENTIEEIQKSPGHEINKMALIQKKLVEGLPSSMAREIIGILSKDPNGGNLINHIEKHLSDSEQKGKIGLEKIEERIDAHMYDESTKLASSIPIYSEAGGKEEGQPGLLVSQNSFIKLSELAETYNYVDERELLEQEIQPAI